MYIVFALVAFGCNVLNTILNKRATKRVSGVLVSFIKSIFLLAGCFFFMLFSGNLLNFANITSEQLVFIILNGVSYSFHSVLYFVAIKKANLHAFSPFMESSILFCSNSIFLLMFFNSVTNDGSIQCLIVYILGLCFFAGSLLLVSFSKKLNEGANRIWLLIAFFSGLMAGLADFFVRYKLQGVHTSVIGTWQNIILVIFEIGLVFLTKEAKDLKNVQWKDVGIIAITGLTSLGARLSKYQAYLYEDSNPALVSTIVTCSFVVIFCYDCFSKKKKIPLILWPVSIMIFVGLLLHLICPFL